MSRIMRHYEASQTSQTTSNTKLLLYPDWVLFHFNNIPSHGLVQLQEAIFSLRQMGCCRPLTTMDTGRTPLLSSPLLTAPSACLCPSRPDHWSFGQKQGEQAELCLFSLCILENPM